MKRFTLVLAAVAVLSLAATSTAHAVTLSQGTATALAVQAVGFHPGHHSGHHRSGWQHGPGGHRPPVVVTRYPRRPVVVVPAPVCPRPPLYYAAPHSGFTYQGHGWGLSIGF